VEVVRTLAEAGANIDHALTNGFTPLYVFAHKGHAEGDARVRWAELRLRLRTHWQHTGQYRRTCCSYHYQIDPVGDRRGGGHQVPRKSMAHAQGARDGAG
jgi:hypothetical protein